MLLHGFGVVGNRVNIGMNACKKNIKMKLMSVVHLILWEFREKVLLEVNGWWWAVATNLR